MAGVLRAIVELLAGVFAGLLLITIVIAGVLMMVAPERARKLLKNAGIAFAIFLLGLTLAQGCLQSLR